MAPKGPVNNLEGKPTRYLTENLFILKQTGTSPAKAWIYYFFRYLIEWNLTLGEYPVYGDPEYADVQRQLQEKLDKLQKKYGDDSWSHT